MSKLLAFLLITVIVFIVDIECDDTTDCDPSIPPPHLTNVSGTLKINNTVVNEGLQKKTCEWIINSTNVKDKNLIHLDIDELILSNRDSLKITKEGANTTLYTSNGGLSPGVILVTNSEKVVRVTLVFSDEDLYRKIDIMYKTNDLSAQLQNIDSAGSFVFAYNDQTLDLTTNFNLILKPKIDSKLLLLNTETFNVGPKGNVTFNNVSKYNETQNFDSNTKPEFLLQNGKQITIKIKDFGTKNNSEGIQLHYNLVDSLCSQYLPLNATDLDKPNTTVDLKLPNATDLQTLSSFKCLNVFEHQNNANAKLLLDLSKFTFLNTEDLITVRDGISHDSKTLAVIESQFLDTYWNQQYLYSSSNKIWIFFDSPQVINKNSTKPINSIGIHSQSQGGAYIFDANTTQTYLQINNQSTPVIPVVYTFTADIGNQIVIDFDKNLLPGNGSQNLINIYESISRNAKPFFTLESNIFAPDIMASNTNELKIEFNQINVNIKATIIKFKKGCHSSAVGTTTSYILSGCNNLCSWLIPKRDNSNGTFVIQFSHLNLLKDSDSINIERIGAKASTVLTLKGPLSTMTFPDVILIANETYVLYTKRNCTTGSIDSSQLLGVSLIYIDQNIRTTEITFNTNDTKVIKPSNYPNYYSIGSNQLWYINEPVANVTNKQKALLSFTDLDLSQSQLKIVYNNFSQNLSNGIQLSELSDFLVTLPLFLNLNSETIDSTKQPFSGRGFSANLNAVDCGDVIKVEPNKPINISTPQSLAGISKCIWTVTTDNTTKSAMNLIEFTLTKGKDFNDKNLIIYDSNSIRDNKVVNQSYFNETKSSSINSMIIEYIIDTKKPADLTIFLNQTVCQRMCETTKRCLLPQFQCNGINDCGDYSDEKCNGTQPLPPPPPPPAPVYVSSGINGWVVFLILCPLSAAIGVLSTLYGPTLMSRFGRGRYREFQDFSEVS